MFNVKSVPLSSISIYSGANVISPKPYVYILTANKASFNTFLALNEVVDRDNFNYIFVEKPEDIDNGQIMILDDFCLNPNITEILDVLNRGLYRSFYDKGLYVNVSGNVGIGTVTTPINNNE